MDETTTQNKLTNSYNANNWQIATAGVVLVAFCGVLFFGQWLINLTLGFVPGIAAAIGSTVLSAILFAIPAGIGFFLPKDQSRYNKWRGITRMFAILAGYTLVTGIVGAFEASQPFPGIPDFILPLVAIVYGLMIFFVSGYHRVGMPWSQRWVALTVGVLLSVGWVLFGALGRFTELVVALGNGIGFGMATALIVSALFHYEPDLPKRRPWLSIGYVWFVVLLLPVLAPYHFAAQLGFLRTGWLLLGLLVGTVFTISQKEKNGEGVWPVTDLLAVTYGLGLAFTNGVEVDFMLDVVLLPYSAAVVIALLVSGLVAIVLLVARKPLGKLSGVITAPILAFTALVVLALYFLVGQPGLQPEAIIVVLKEQADSSAAQSIEDYDERRGGVYQQLTAHAASTQSELRAWLDERGVEYTPYYLVNSIAVRGNVFTRWQIASHPDVDYVLNDYLVRPIHPIGSGSLLDEVSASPSPPFGGLPWGIDRIDADRVWEELSIEGEGIIMGNADSGVDWEHPAVRSQYLGAEGNHDYTWFDPRWGSPVPAYTGGHGTHTLGTSIGQDGIGVAPGANWIACRNLPTNRGRVSDYIACMEFLFAPFPIGGDAFTDGDVTRGAHVTNNSWGCPPEEGCDGFTMPIAIEHLRNAGQMMVVSAGNSGPTCSTIGVPATADQAFSVGAINESGVITGFSSRGPVLFDGSGNLKPDITAPGDNVYSSIPNNSYAYFPGTSMAGPHVAGVVALMWSANPELIGDIDATEQILIDTAEYKQANDLCGADDGERNNVYGYGIVDAFEAVQAALEYEQ
ncbi:MAG: peptidase S8 [Chloroflexi bacterium]|nr:MAG: peptidase S8 [Chloroflexota bacterium]MBL1195218.1 peptidase S8 [Chloroflexota bacterium]NOH12503.1 S8 family serine peptidase [Chloroflexota bacterium]